MSSRLSKLFKGRAASGDGATVEAEPQPAPPGEQPAVAAAPGNRDAVLASLSEKVIALSEGRLTPAEIDPAGHMLDYGYVDSMSAAELLTFIEDQYGVQIPDVEIAGRLATLDALVDFVGKERSR